jgi:predicted dehydrogenase
VTDLPTGRVRVAVVGCGGRGTVYSSWILEHPGQAVITAVVDPRASARDRLGDRADVPAEHRYADWRELLSADPAGRVADAVLICTQDRQHAEPAIAFADAGWHILLEKPMAPTEQECRDIHAAVTRAGVLFAVAHVLRYAAYTRAVKQVVDSGELGLLVNIEHLEPVGYWHFAHSYVRGNWRREDETGPMVLAKCCHDLDWLGFLVGRACVAVASFGSLLHLRPERRPEGAGDRCLDCAIEPGCPYSARRIYLDRARRGETGWPVEVLDWPPTPENVERALREGPYGRCVWACDNDVVDHQVVNLRYEHGVTASLTMTAFTRMRERETRIFGTRGELYGDGAAIEIYDFAGDRTTRHEVDATGGVGAKGGHGGGDDGVMAAFVAAVAAGDPALVPTSPAETLASHRVAFAAEAARREDRVVSLAPR